MITTNEPKPITKKFDYINALKCTLKSETILKGIISGDLIIHEYYNENSTLVFLGSELFIESDKNLTGLEFYENEKYYYYIENVDIGSFVFNLLEMHKKLIREKINDLKEWLEKW